MCAAALFRSVLASAVPALRSGSIQTHVYIAALHRSAFLSAATAAVVDAAADANADAAAGQWPASIIYYARNLIHVTYLLLNANATQRSPSHTGIRTQHAARPHHHRLPQRLCDTFSI